MASKKMLVVAVAALAAVLLPAFAVATEHIVGDDKGWVLRFDYDAWADTKQFVVGDTLVFTYASADHSVVEVDEPYLTACKKPANANVRKSGEDRITLDKAGRWYFLCDVSDHCARGMRLKIKVLETAAPSPGLETAAPAPGSPSTPPASSPAGKVQESVGKAAAAAVTALAAAVLVL